MERLHIDLSGPIRATPLNGKKYGFVIVYNYSIFAWVKFLAHKDESYKVFTTFCKTSDRGGQNKKGFCVSKVRSDRGGKFENELFEKYLEENGVPKYFSFKNTSTK